MIRTLRHTVLAAAFGLAFAGPAFAHAHLASATPPANGNAAQAPSQLTLSFTEDVNLAFTNAKVTGPDGKAITTGKEKLKPSSDRTLVVPLSSPLNPGTYTVKWQALSKDGHKTHGSYHFTVGGK